MIGDPQPPSLMKAVKKAIDNEIETIVAEEAKLAAERTEKRVRGMMGQTTAIDGRDKLSIDMKPPTHAPFFACLYAALCETARAYGYALSIHGTVTSDLDVIAVPWTEQAEDPETLMQALMRQIGAVDYRGLLTRDCASWATEKQIDEMVEIERERIGETRGPLDCAMKPHGRKAWNLYLEHGCKVDLSVMPRIV